MWLRHLHVKMLYVTSVFKVIINWPWIVHGLVRIVTRHYQWYHFPQLAFTIIPVSVIKISIDILLMLMLSVYVASIARLFVPGRGIPHLWLSFRFLLNVYWMPFSSQSNQSWKVWCMCYYCRGECPCCYCVPVSGFYATQTALTLYIFERTGLLYSSVTWAIKVRSAAQPLWQYIWNVEGLLWQAVKCCFTMWLAGLTAPIHHADGFLGFSFPFVLFWSALGFIVRPLVHVLHIILKGVVMNDGENKDGQLEKTVYPDYA